MKKLLPLSMFFLFSFNGCLIFHKMSYDIKLDEPEKGTATVFFYDIRSDARSEKEFEEDKTNLFNYISESPEFIAEFRKEGREVLSRDLFLSGDTLNGKFVYSFDNISVVEKIMYEDGFYYLTLPLEDSILSTNGEVIVSPQYKRILWDGRERNIKFEMFSTSFSAGDYKTLAEFYRKK